MFDTKMKLLSTVAAVPLVFGAAFAFNALETISGQSNVAYAASDPCNPCAAKKACNPCNPCAAKKACNPCNPCAAKKACNPCNPCAAKKACNPCNPCAAKKACNPCNPCAAKACNPCNPCAAKACNPCNPCAAACNPCNPCAAKAAGGGPGCYIPRLKTAAANNPCAAKKACNPCNPCAAKACNPCAAKACNPCAAKKACNPCAAKACNPCAAKKACNPCAAKKACNPCNPCAAKKACNPCNPCAAACNPCNPCAAAAAAPELTEEELTAAYNCIYPKMVKGYAKAGIPAAKGYKKWAKRFSRVAYQSDTHGGRMVNNYANSTGKKAYAKFEDLKKAPQGSVFIKDSFSIGKNGSVSAGPIFLMEKKKPGFDSENNDWRYYLILPNGSLFGTTNGKNSAGVKFCIDCHRGGEDTDFLLFLPEEVRVSSK